VVWAQAPQNCDLQSPRNWGSRAVPSSSGEPLNEYRADNPEQFDLQSPHHRGSHSTGWTSAPTSPSSSSFSPLIIGEAAQQVQRPGHLEGPTFSPLIIGKAAQPIRSSARGLRLRTPSVPSSSGKPLNFEKIEMPWELILQSPHHRGSRSTWTHPGRRQRRRDAPSVPSSSGKPLNMLAALSYLGTLIAYPLQSPHHRGNR
jgi:hypothetical protein